MPKVSKPAFLLLGAILVGCLSFGAIWCFNKFAGHKPYRSPEEVRAACEKKIIEADAKAKAAVEKHAAAFQSFINSRKNGARAFSEDAVSLYGKWRAVKPYLPFTEKDGHKQYVIERFDKHIFTSQELSDAIRRSIEGAAKDIQGIENDLAVELRKEILGRSLQPDESALAAQEFQKAVSKIVSASQWDAAKTVGNLVVSEVVATVGTQVLIRLGVSAGILATGAANSWWSFGASAVIGLVVDVVWEWIDKPAKKMEAEMVSALDGIGRKGSTAIREEMLKVVQSKRDLWSKAVVEMINK